MVINISRLARKNINTPFLHVMVQGVNKEYIFYKEYYIELYLKLIFKYKDEFNILILAYCMMNNHAHFLMYAENIEKLGFLMKKVNLQYARFYNKIENRCGVLFRNRYKVEPINEMKYLINCVKYIHENPVKAKMVACCGAYKYSSYNDYITNSGVSKNQIFNEMFGSGCDYVQLFTQTHERAFMDVENDSNIVFKELIESGIQYFIKRHSSKLYEIFIDKELFKELIKFLKNNCALKYSDIGNYFEISRRRLDNFK